MMTKSEVTEVLRGLHHCRLASCFDCPYRTMRNKDACRKQLMDDARSAIIQLRDALDAMKN